MGQIFYATVYDTKKKECFSEDADKFHANCYSFSYAVRATHDLLRKSAYRVMWYGQYFIMNNFIDDLSEEELLGISINCNLEDFKYNYIGNTESLNDDKIKFIDENHKLWKKISVDKPKSINYKGYLVNHSKKEAVDLKEYYDKSIIRNRNGNDYLIDLIPPLTETGQGTEMALFDGGSSDVTEDLIGTWCGDLLQLVDNCPENYKKINCCFAPILERARYCKQNFGLDNENFILKNKKGDRYEGIKFHFTSMKRVNNTCYFKYEENSEKIIYRPIINERKRKHSD